MCDNYMISLTIYYYYYLISFNYNKSLYNYIHLLSINSKFKISFYNIF